MKNIVITGMPSAGKRSMGMILAKTMKRNFIEMDIVIQEKTGRFLQEIIDTGDHENFLKIEEYTILFLDCHDAVIATVRYTRSTGLYPPLDGFTQIRQKTHLITNIIPGTKQFFTGDTG